MLQVKNIYFSRENPILIDVNLTLKKGFLLGLVGLSGAGKSTLLKIIAGLLDADKGNVFLKKQEVFGPKNRLIAGHPEIQLVNQDFSLDVFHTVEENVRLKCLHLPEKERKTFILELLYLAELSHLKQRKAHEISGGEQQRLAIIRAFALEPKIILLDEPFVHLDKQIKEKFIEYILLLKRIRKTSFIFVSHDGQEVLSLADEIAYFKNGQIQRIASPNDFYYHPTNEEEAHFFGKINVYIWKRKKILFRPNEFQIEPYENAIEVNLKFIKKHFFGCYYLDEYLVKNKPIFLLGNKNSVPLQKIYIGK